MTNRTWKQTVLGIPAIGVSALPKIVCPLCSPAYAAVVSSLGVGFLASTRYLLPLTTVLLALALASLFVGATSRRGRRPFWFGTTAATFILMGKFAFDSAAVMYAGIGLLLLTSTAHDPGLLCWLPVGQKSALNRQAGRGSKWQRPLKCSAPDAQPARTPSNW